ncbi:MAG: hypothetical protein WBC44_04875 [Planctomycetaceae bacterium]
MFTRRLPSIVLGAFLVSAVAVQPVAAQEAARTPAGSLSAEATPDIRGVLVNSQAVLDRLATVIGLTTPNEQQQHAALKDFVDVFLFGVDVNKPVRMDIMTGGPESTYRLHVPVDNFKDFWQLNLEPLGIPVQRYPKPAYLYKLGGDANAAFSGFMLYDPKARGGYATIVEDSKQLPAPKGPVPTEGVQNLLDSGFDAALQLQNSTADPESIEQRHAHFAKERAKNLDQLKRDVDESVSDFNLRKFATQTQFAESERLYAESRNLVAGLTVASEKSSGSVKLHIEPLPKTSLAESVAILGQQPSRFSGIPRGENAATTGRIHFPLDNFRKQNLLSLLEKMRANELEEVDATEAGNADEKAADKAFINGVFDRVAEGLNQGVIDGFVEMTKGQDGIYSMVGAVKSADGTQWAPVLEILPNTSRHTNLKMNVAEHGGVKLHEIMIAKESHADFHALFGSGRLLLATGPDAIWYAAGPNADESLKQAIDQSAQPGQAEPQVVSFRGELLPWIRILDQRLGTSGRDKYRDMAIQAFQKNEGRLMINVERKGDAVDGEIAFDRGVLRFIGKALANFSAENLAAD